MPKYPDELCKLVILNMAIVEEAPSVKEEVEKVLFAAINKRIEDHVAKRAGWEGVYDLVTGEDETYFYPAGWPKNEDEAVQAWYELKDEDDEDDLGWLSCAIGSRNASLSLRFNVSKDLGKVTAKEHKKRCKAFYDEMPNTKLQSNGF